MAKGTTEKEIFSILGQFRQTEQGKKFIPSSPEYYRDRCSKMPLDKKFVARFYAKVPSRSQAQLSYHMVLMGYISEYSGCTPEEAHDAVMRAKYGVKKVKIGDIVEEVRQSVSDKALFPKYWMVELIQYDLELCKKLNIHVPTMEELGYISNDKPYH
jgi:hypothetical protein